MDEIEKVLDSHGSVYAQTTAKYITEDMLLEERIELWHEADRKHKADIESIITKREKALLTGLKDTIEVHEGDTSAGQRILARVQSAINNLEKGERS